MVQPGWIAGRTPPGFHHRVLNAAGRPHALESRPMSDTRDFLDRFWEDEILPSLTEYVAVPNVSVLFDPDWEAHGHMEAALQMGKTFMAKHAPNDAVLHVGRIPGRTPLLLLDCPGEADGTILMYGHLDKQPEMVGWREGLGPWSPVREGDKLYGRGGADDGYALYCALAALKAVAREGEKRARVVLLVEFSEESGSPDLPAYMESCADVIGTPDLVICLDSGAGNYDQLWSTTSLRGMVGGTLKAEVLTEGVHSGDAGGVVPPPFLVLRKLLDRLEEPGTDRIVPDALHAEIPAERIAQAEAAAETLGADTFSRFPWAGNTGAPGVPTSELILNRTWRPNLAITGQDGLPSLAKAGNVLLPQVTLNLSFRIPPTVDPAAAQAAIREIVERDPPFGAKVTLHFHEPAQGWSAPALAPWLGAALDEASMGAYGKPAMHMGEGGSIPFMGMLGERFPEAQFVITGVLGPGSNAHGPNEFLEIAYAKRLTEAVATVIARHATRG